MATTTVPPLVEDSSTQSIYSFPFPSSNKETNEVKSNARKPAPVGGLSTTSASEKSRPNVVCSEIPRTTARHFLHRRLLLPTFIIPVALLCIPPLLVSLMAFLAYNVTGSGGSSTSFTAIIFTTSTLIASTLLFIQTGEIAITKYFDDEKARKKFMTRSAVSLPFWSAVLSIFALRLLLSIFNVFRPLFAEASPTNEATTQGWMNSIFGLIGTTSFWSYKTCRITFLPSLAWTCVSILVAIRYYAGPFSAPILRCSSTPLKTNPLDAAFTKFGRNFTSKNRFLDMVADGLDKLSAATSPDQTKKATASASTTQKMDDKKPLLQPNNKNTPNAAKKKSSDDASGKSGIIELLKISSNGNARYSRPGFIIIALQVVLNIIGGLIFAEQLVLRFLGYVLIRLDETIVVVTVMSCVLVLVFELFSTITETELHYGHYSSAGDVLQFLFNLGSDVLQRIQRSLFGYAMVTPIIATVTISLWAHFDHYLLIRGTFSLAVPTYPAIMQSLLISYMTVAFTVVALAIQDVLTRWAVCAPGVDADVLLYQTLAKSKDLKKQSSTSVKSGVNSSPNNKRKFLTEDLLIQSILMGDGNTVSQVIASPDTDIQPNRALFKSHQDDEISRNDKAVASFAKWIQISSTTESGRLSDDILRMSLLEALGGGGSCPTDSHYFGEVRHSSALRKRLELSAATATPGQQPIAAPVIRALCAFAGGVGDSMNEIYGNEKKDSKSARNADIWKLPPGTLVAAQFSIVASARLVVMNSSVEKRHERICLLLPCVLQSAYKLRCGLLAYARATAKSNEVKLASFDETGRTDGLLQFIEQKCSDLCPALSACNDSARMVIQIDRALEDFVLRRSWKNDMQQWLVGLNCEQ